MGFGRDIRKFVEKTKVREDIAIRAFVLDVFRQLLEESPVDQGRYRANWNVSVGSPNLDASKKGRVKTARKPATPTEEARANAALAEFEPGDTIWLTNNVPYAEALENGHSRKQAPNGVVAVVLPRALKDFSKHVNELPG